MSARRKQTLSAQTAVKASAAFLANVTIDSRTVLNGPTTYKADRISIGPNGYIVTNGNQLSFQSKIMEIQGSPQIIAFEAERVNRGPANPGHDAGPIMITTDEIRGTTLRVRNFGERGAPGAQGAKGPKGPPGVQGQQQGWDPIHGCHGGTNSSDGGPGGTGGEGQQGGTGGRGGDVVLSIKKGLVFGSQWRVNIETPIRGGRGGVGGPGGSGGDGGDGAPGAPGNAHCGGTNGGGPGPIGNSGPTGRQGIDGAEGRIYVVPS